MRKEELRKLRALPATKQMMEKGKNFKERKVKHSWEKKARIYLKPEYDVLFRVQNLAPYIKVAVFFPGDMRKDIKTPRYEIFLNVEGEEYITRELDKNGKEVRWLTSMLTNLSDTGFGYWSDTKYFISADGMNTLNGLKLERESTKPQKGAYRLQAWQQEKKDKDTKRKEEREQAPWDADMALVPQIPPNFGEWMRKDAVENVFIFYEYNSKGQETGYCSRCKRYVPIKAPKHNKDTRCPLCKAKAVFKAHSRISTLSTGWYYGEIIQRIKGGIVIRQFDQYQYYRGTTYTNPKVLTNEKERILIFEDGTVKRYYWDKYKNKFLRWCLDKEYIPEKRTYYWGERIKLYKHNMAQLKKHSLLKHSALDLWPTLPTSTTSYLAIEKGNPAVEKLARLGMFRLAKELMNMNYDKNLLDQNETELAKMLKIDGSRLKRLKEMGANVYSLKWMQYEKFANTIWPDEMIKDFGEAGFNTSEFGFLHAPISFVKCHNYLLKQSKIMDESLKQTLITWRDYHNMADKAKMNTKCDQIARPKDLKYAHDELVLLTTSKGLEKEAKAIEKKWPKVNKQLPKLKKFEFTEGEYTIVAPGTVLDIVTEGAVLKHCVHTCDYYFSRIQSDESYLFFLRHSKQPDMPWYTLEVEPNGNIRQKRTTGDNQNPDFEKAVGFLKKWQKYFKKQLTEEEKKLGEKANLLRLENYDNLRKNGNRVWHGKLAGKLLADVLEADFMEAAEL